MSATTVAPGASVTAAYEPVAVDSYTVYIGEVILSTTLPSTIKQRFGLYSKYIIISDTVVAPLYAQPLCDALLLLGLSCHIYVVPSGESSKSRAVKSSIEDFLFNVGAGRDACILAVGGGVIGDLSGFVAATYMRGIAYIHIPTTLLAMVDSSIGGKTGIDTPAGKNLLGAFHRPKAVFIDIAVLATLPLRELYNGLAESIKAGAIDDEALFTFIEVNGDRIKARDLSVLAHIIHRSVVFKARVVCADEKEGGLRAILNFGHSIGHAIEAYMQPQLLHGECVAIGMMEEALLARSRGLVTSAVIRRIDQCCKQFSLPTRIPAHLTAEQLIERMGVDKKNKNGKKEIVMITSIGSVVTTPSYTTTITDDELYKLFSPSIMMCTGVAHGTVAVPGSKSLSNRILLLASMGAGICKINGLLHSQDTQVMIDSLRQIGVEFQWENKQTTLVVHGLGGVHLKQNLKTPKKHLYLHNAGTASRFLTTLACCIPSGQTILTGNERMRQRPIADLVTALRLNGHHIEYNQTDGCLPITITSVGGFQGGNILLRANISSQYVSSILLNAANAITPVILKLDTTNSTKVVSKPFIDMTIELMKQFNIHVDEPEPFTYMIRNGGYSNPPTFDVEGDASSATYPLTLAAVTGGSVTVSNVGSASLQGDAKFVTLLQNMGATVSQTPMTTTVHAAAATVIHRNNNDNTTLPLLQAIDVDMDSMTDCFMTLAAAAVFAQGTTRITNIANQRVKECNRLAVMVEELTKCGVTCRETESGMEIDGMSMTHTDRVDIECHDDHRIAMSFAVVGARRPNVVITDKRCIDKTYPEFFEDCERSLQLETILPTKHSDLNTTTTSSFSSSSPSIVLIGMRGSGKTTMGRIAAAHLNRSFIDVDTELEKVIGNLRDYVHQHGWSDFRIKELEIFKQIILQYSTNTVISCGGGLVETSAARDILTKHTTINVLLTRHIDDIVKYLNFDTTRPSFDAITTYNHRRQWYQQCSQYEFTIRHNDINWLLIQSEFINFLSFITGVTTTPVISFNSFFISLTASNINTIASDFTTITQGVDAVEIRIDLLAEYTPEYIADTIAHIRRLTHLPIIFTVRSSSQGGKFIGTEEEMFQLLHLAIRYACEWIDMECASTLAQCERLVAKKGQSLIIGSHHCPHDNGGADDTLIGHFALASFGGRVDAIKVVVSASDVSDAVRIIHIAQSQSQRYNLPVISLAMGNRGRISRVLNKFLTPVTHPLLPTAAAPGQLTVATIQSQRFLLGLIESREYYIFGSPITHSPSPIMHNTGFEWCGLPYRYDRCETTDIERVKQVLSTPLCAGGNVTMPLKEVIIPLLSTLSPSAKAIGAINTIVRQADGSLFGDNTDWIGMILAIKKISPAATMTVNNDADQRRRIAIVIGAGGTARAALYACTQLGYTSTSLLLHNPRTPHKATELAKQFNATPINNNTLTLDTLAAAISLTADKVSINLIISTLPSASNITLDPSILSLHDKPVIFDVGYIPYDTALTKQASLAACPIVRGIDMIIEQGIKAFDLWTNGRGFSARKAMENAVHKINEVNVRASANANASTTASSTVQTKNGVKIADDKVVTILKTSRSNEL